MIGLSLVLFLGGAPGQPQPDPAELRLIPAVVVMAEGAPAPMPEDDDNAPKAQTETPKDAAPPVSLRQASVLQPSEPTKEP